MVVHCTLCQSSISKGHGQKKHNTGECLNQTQWKTLRETCSAASPRLYYSFLIIIALCSTCGTLAAQQMEYNTVWPEDICFIQTQMLYRCIISHHTPHKIERRLQRILPRETILKTLHQHESSNISKVNFSLLLHWQVWVVEIQKPSAVTFLVSFSSHYTRL